MTEKVPIFINISINLIKQVKISLAMFLEHNM
jgi:hypothetical protein